MQKHSVDCEFWDGQTVSYIVRRGDGIEPAVQIDVLMTDDLAKAAAQNMKDYLACGGDARDVTEVLDPLEAEKVGRSLASWCDTDRV